MFIKKISLILLIYLSYQTQLLSKSTTLNELDAKNLSNYFSGIVAYENKENNRALDFFHSVNSGKNCNEQGCKIDDKKN